MTDHIRERHRPSATINRIGPNFAKRKCLGCGAWYPCDAIRAADQRDAERRERVEEVEALTQTLIDLNQQAAEAERERDALLAAFSSEHVKWLQRVSGYPADWRPDDLADWLDMVLDDIGAHLRADA